MERMRILIVGTPARNELIKHVLAHHKHWEPIIKTFNNNFLLANAHPDNREYYHDLLINENKGGINNVNRKRFTTKETRN